MISIFLLLLVLPCIEPTRFYLNGTMTCETSDPVWCFNITAVELDSFSLEDEIASFRTCVPENVTTVTYELDGVQEGDGWFDGFFEIGYRISHTCAVFDIPYEVYALQQQLPVWKPFYHEEKQFNLNKNTVKHIHSFCDEPHYDCHLGKRFYFVLGVDFNVKRSGYKVIRLYGQ